MYYNRDIDIGNSAETLSEKDNSSRKSAASAAAAAELSRSAKNRPSKVRSRPSKNWRNLETVKTLAGRLAQPTPSVTSVAASHERLAMSSPLGSSRESVAGK